MLLWADVSRLYNSRPLQHFSRCLHLYAQVYTLRVVVLKIDCQPRLLAVERNALNAPELVGSAALHQSTDR